MPVLFVYNAAFNEYKIQTITLQIASKVDNRIAYALLPFFKIDKFTTAIAQQDVRQYICQHLGLSNNCRR